MGQPFSVIAHSKYAHNYRSFYRHFYFSAIFYHRWSKDEFTQGAYSEPVVGTTSQDFKNLGERLGRLYFAGEATSEDWYGYMQGAYLSGKEKGQMIADHIMGVSAEADDILEDDAVVHEEL